MTGHESFRIAADRIKAHVALEQPEDHEYAPAGTDHDIVLRYVRLGLNDRIQVLYMGLRYCTKCHDAEPAMGVTLDPELPVISVKDMHYKLKMESECWMVKKEALAQAMLFAEETL